MSGFALEHYILDLAVAVFISVFMCLKVIGNNFTRHGAGLFCIRADIPCFVIRSNIGIGRLTV
jgi:hypothetical protein